MYHFHIITLLLLCKSHEISLTILVLLHSIFFGTVLSFCYLRKYFIFIDLIFIIQGSILPNDTLKLSFVFKSNESGIYTERWQLLTRPVLCGGRPIIFTLRGVTTEEDIHRETRNNIEVCL